MAIFIVPVTYFSGGFDGLSNNPPTEPAFSYQLIMALLGFGLYCAINWNYLKLYGQTVGKKVLGIKVVYLDGAQPPVTVLVFKRYAFYIFMPYVPLIGGIVSMVGILMVFGKQRRALHDRIANTKVINCARVTSSASDSTYNA
jgi:uncharacterized RDD family membrane protein YckC